MTKKSPHHATFIIRIIDTQNTTWQGTVTWADELRTESFRSTLELIKLLDSTLLRSELEEEAVAV